MTLTFLFFLFFLRVSEVLKTLKAFFPEGDSFCLCSAFSIKKNSGAQLRYKPQYLTTKKSACLVFLTCTVNVERKLNDSITTLKTDQRMEGLLNNL